jgi:hypothetical protein
MTVLLGWLGYSGSLKPKLAVLADRIATARHRGAIGIARKASSKRRTEFDAEAALGTYVSSFTHLLATRIDSSMRRWKKGRLLKVNSLNFEDPEKAPPQGQFRQSVFHLQPLVRIERRQAAQHQEQRRVRSRKHG